MTRKTRVVIVVIISIVLLGTLIAFFAAFGSAETVIAKFDGKSILLGDYNRLIEFNSRLCVKEKRSYIMRSLCYASWLEKRGITVSDDDISDAFGELAKNYFENGAFNEQSAEIAVVAGVKADDFKASLGCYAASVAVTEAFSEYAKTAFEAQDKASENYIGELDAYTESISEEALTEKTALVTSGGTVVNGVTTDESVYIAFLDFIAVADRYETVQAVALYVGIDRLYGSEADITDFEAYFETIYTGIKKISDYQGILTDMGVGEVEFVSQAKRYYRTVYIYEQLCGEFFKDQFVLKQTAGTLPSGVDTLEQYVSLVLIETALRCKNINIDF